MNSTILLRIYQNKNLIHVKQFSQDQVTIGRNGDLDLVLESDKVAPIHALIERRDSGFYLCDLGSEFGVTLNQQKTLDSAIKHEDEIGIGPYTIQFFEGIPKPKTAPVAGPPPIKMPSQVHAATSVQRSSKGTYAPQSKHKDLRDVLVPSAGTVVEVLVAWGDRVLNTYHLHKVGMIFAGWQEDSDVRLPLSTPMGRTPLLVIGQQVEVLLTNGVFAEIVDAQKVSKALDQLQKEGRVNQGAQGKSFFLQTKELVRIQVPDSEISIWIRFVPEAPKPLALPYFNFSSQESTAVIVTVIITGILALFMNIYTPEPEEEIEEPQERVVIFKYDPPTPAAPIIDSPTPEVAPKEKQVEKQAVVQTQTEPKKAEKKSGGETAQIAPKKTTVKKPELTSVAKPKITKPGASIEPGAVKKPAPPKPEVDVKSVGIFGSGGVRENIGGSDSSFAGLREVTKGASAAAGESDRPGSGLNAPRTKEGAGGQGIAPIGRADVKISTPGVGSGGRGQIGSGLEKGSASIDISAEVESLSGGMDREAIRRVIREHLSEFKNCYEIQLNKNQNLAGKLVLKWEIGDGGIVGKVEAVNRGDTIREKRVTKCCMDVIKGLRFPNPPPNMVGVVQYPFVFSSQ